MSEEIDTSDSNCISLRLCKQPVKRVLYISLAIIFFIAIYPAASLLKPEALDVSTLDTSDHHVAHLLKQWEEEKKKATRRENVKEFERNFTGGTYSAHQGATTKTGFETRKKNIAYIKAQKQRTLQRNRFDAETQRIANETSGFPRYSNFVIERYIGANAEPFECIELKSSPRIPICLYSSNEDVFVSKQIRELGIWEEHIVLQFQSVLSRDASLGVIDLGANIGQYSLIAAKMGHRVLAVEPWGPSLERFRVSANLAGTAHLITVLRNSIFDRRAKVCLRDTTDNQGNVYIQEDSRSGNSSYNKCIFWSDSLYLDDLLPWVNFKKAVMKIDIQGFEHRAFLHAQNLLNHVHIPYIFMEWVIMREFWMTSSHESLDKSIVRYLITLLTERNYKVFSLVSKKRLDIRYWYGWPEDIVWVIESEIQGIGNPIRR